MLPKERRLVKKGEFDRVFNTGRVVNRPNLRIVWSKGSGKAALVVAKSVGSNAYRNSVRRRWREALRVPLASGLLPIELDMVFVVKPKGSKLKGREAAQELSQALGQIAP